MASDDPIFLVDDAGAGSVRFAIPDRHRYLGIVPEAEFPQDLPRLFIDWAVSVRLQGEGQRSIKEDREVAGILLGTCSEDTQTIKVSHIAVARDEDSSPVHFKFTYSVWDDLIDQMEEMSRASGEKLLLLGWYHTHPNMAVFLSRYDLRTHRDFHRPYQFALVLAPKAGTPDTSVGFFVNRGEGLPLLPGVCLYGVEPRTDFGRTLPWRFQVLEAEGIEEGEIEKGQTGDARAVSEPPRVFQLGVIKEGRGDWLQLQADPSEGPVLPILEGMAAAVVDDRSDRLGVLLGMRTEEGNTVISRVRFLGKLKENPDEERRDLLTALGFIAEQFPSSGLQKILGVVRIVSPHRFQAGDRYDPAEHNITIARFLREIHYEFEEYVAQVALVLYPGIEDDLLYFQVFAQLGDSLIVRTGLQALASPAARANERYEPIAQRVFVVEEPPCLTPPRSGVPARPKAHRLPEDAMPTRTEEMISIPDMTGNVGVVDEVAPTESGNFPISPSSPARGRLIALAALLVLAVVIALALGRGGGPNSPRDPASVPSLSGDELGLDPPYDPAAVLPKCGVAAWNPEAVCQPFLDQDDPDAVLEFARVTPTSTYTNLTVAPPEAWLVPAEGSGRKRVQLERQKAGDASVFLLHRRGATWDQLWGQGEPFAAKLVILPRVAFIDGGDEYDSLRLVTELRMQGPLPTEENGPTPGEARTGTPAGWTPSVVRLGGGAQAAWDSMGGGLERKVSFDLEREAFEEIPVIAAVGLAPGDWGFEVMRQRGGSPVGKKVLANQDPSRGSGEVNPRTSLVELFRDAEVAAMLRQVAEKPDPSVWVLVRPPEGTELSLHVALVGKAKALRVRHKICVTLVDEAEGGGLRSISGQVDIGLGEWRPTAALLDGGRSQCTDKNRANIWHLVEINEENAVLRFTSPKVRSQDNDLLSAGLRINLRAWATKDRGSQCLSVQIRLNQAGLPAEVPDVRSIGRLDGDRCR